MINLKPKWIKNWAETYRKGGFRMLLKDKGWKVVLAFFVFYFVRDTILFIIIPWLGINQLSSCF